MPNWIENIITIEDNAEVIKKIKEFVKGEQIEIEDGKKIRKASIFDFDKIIPMPEEIKKTMYEKKLTEEEGKALTEKYGNADWYDWSCENWGTKWNTNEAIECDKGFEFDTAWACPLQIIQALSKKFPEVKFNVKYADEDTGYNCGEFNIWNNNITIISKFKEGSEEANRFACEVHGQDYDEWMEMCNE